MMTPRGPAGDECASDPWSAVDAIRLAGLILEATGRAGGTRCLSGGRLEATDGAGTANVESLLGGDRADRTTVAVDQARRVRELAADTRGARRLSGGIIRRAVETGRTERLLRETLEFLWNRSTTTTTTTNVHERCLQNLSTWCEELVTDAVIARQARGRAIASGEVSGETTNAQ